MSIIEFFKAFIRDPAAALDEWNVPLGPNSPRAHLRRRQAQFAAGCPPSNLWRDAPAVDGTYERYEGDANMPRWLVFEEDGSVLSDHQRGGPWDIHGGRIAFSVRLWAFEGPIGPDTVHLQAIQYLLSGEPIDYHQGRYRLAPSDS